MAVEGPVERIPAMIQQLENLSQAIGRLEGLIHNEISDLKNEQIADLKRAVERIADDQRRLWEAVRAIENARSATQGGVKTLYAVFVIASSILSSFVTVFVTRIFK